MVTGASSGASFRPMTPENIEQLKQLKALFDEGVLSTEEFELQKRGILSSPEQSVDAPWSIEEIELDEGFIVSSSERSVNSPPRPSNVITEWFSLWRSSPTSTNDIVQAADDNYKREVVDEGIRAAGRVQILAYLFAFAGIIFGIILMAYGNSDDVESAGPYVGAGVSVALNAVVLAIILHAIGKYMEARLVQGSDQQGKSQ